MKTIKIALIVFITLASFSSCKKGGVFCYKANGEMTKEMRTLKDFSKISLDMDADIYIEQNETYSVEVESSKNLLEIIETEVSGSMLTIKLKKGKCIKNNFDINIHIGMPELNAIILSGSGDVIIKDSLTTNNFDVSISGGGDVEVNKLFAKKVDVDLSGSGSLYVASTDTLDTEKIRISGSGQVRMINLLTKKADIEISGSGDTEVYVIERLDASITGSGSVKYKGSPELVTSISGSGTIREY